MEGPLLGSPSGSGTGQTSGQKANAHRRTNTASAAAVHTESTEGKHAEHTDDEQSQTNTQFMHPIILPVVGSPAGLSQTRLSHFPTKDKWHASPTSMFSIAIVITLALCCHTVDPVSTSQRDPEKS